MINLRNLNAAMESSYMEDSDSDVTIEQTIEIEVAASEETQEAIELEESVAESDDITEETEQMLATLEFAAHAEAIVEEFGWSRPVATMLNRNQDVENGIPGDLEVFLGVTMPANESLDMVSSAYDDNTVAALEGFKETLIKVWEWIKKQARRIKDFIVDIFNRFVNLFRSYGAISKRYAEAIRKMTLDSNKYSNKEFKLIPYSKLDTSKFAPTAEQLMNQAKVAADEITKVTSKVNFDTITQDQADKLAKDVTDVAAKVMNAKSGTFSKLGFKINDNGTIDMSKFLESYKPTKMTAKKAGFTIDNCKDNTIVIGYAGVSTILPKVANAAVSALSAMSKACEKAEKTASDEMLASALKITAVALKKALSVMTDIQSVCVKLSKFLDHLCRCFIAGQRAILACRK